MNVMIRNTDRREIQTTILLLKSFSLYLQIKSPRSTTTTRELQLAHFYSISLFMYLYVPVLAQTPI